MTALRFLALWVLAAFVVAGLWAALASRHRRRRTEPTCPGCRDRDRQLLNARDHIRLLERANAGLAAKVFRLEARRRGVA